MKQVLVIEDWIEFLTVYGLSKKDGDCLIRDYGSPGNLLASFENKAVFCTDKAGGKRDLCFRIEESDTIRQDEDYHVLILGGKK